MVTNYAKGGHTTALPFSRQNVIPCYRRFHHRAVVGRPNQHPNLDCLGHTSPPIPLLWSKTMSFQNRPNLGRFLASNPNWVAKTPHGYIDINGGEILKCDSKMYNLRVPKTPRKVPSYRAHKMALVPNFGGKCVCGRMGKMAQVGTMTAAAAVPRPPWCPIPSAVG